MIDLAPEYLEKVRTILRQYVPQCEVRAFGSRVRWTAKDYSDLDLAVICSGKVSDDTLSHLKEAFEESDLPFRIDVLDWHVISPEFQKVIEKQYEVVQGVKRNSGTAGDNWTETTLGEIAFGRHGLVDGPFGSNLPASAYTPYGIPVIRGTNLSLGETRFFDEGFVFVSEDTAGRLARSICIPGDVVFTKKGTIGQTGMVPLRGRFKRYLLSSNQMKLSVDPAKADPLFVYYAVSSPAGRDKIVQDASVTGVPKTNVLYFRDFPIRLPPLPEQHTIAHILGTLDDKIELNRRMNETLEAMARALFKSWFVDFDPVRAKVEGRDPGLSNPLADLFPDSFDDSELGEIPTGWKVGSLADVAENPRRCIQPSAVSPSTPYIGLEHMPRRSIALSEWGEAGSVGSNKSEFKRGEILFGKLRPYFHKVGVAPTDGVCSSDIVVARPKDEGWFGFVLEHMASARFVEYTNAGSTGTKMPRTNWDQMSRYPIVRPTVDVALRFNQLTEPFVQRIIAGIYQSRSLAALRDTLLPKLISGEIRVRDVGTNLRECRA
jgi:type I restriction enzyme S subunit